MPHLPRRATASAALLVVASATLAAQRPLNLDFERATLADSTRVWGWTPGWSTALPGPPPQIVLDARAPRQGVWALRITAADTVPDAPARQLMLQLPADFVRGARLTLTGAIRTGPLRGEAVVSLEAWGDHVVPAADSAIRVGVPSRRRRDGLGRWQPFSLTLTVPTASSIHSIVVMAAVVGHGTAWFDDLRLTRNGVAVAQLPSVAEPTAGQLRWLRERSAPLGPAGSASPGADFALFDRIVGTARVIGLGESTHGTADFFTEKHRLIQHLVETQGVRVFALEDNQRDVAALDRYVRDGVGSAHDALAPLFAVWKTDEMVRFVDWLRRYNAAHPQDPVHVVGIDMQDQRRPADSLLAFLGQRAPAMQPVVAELMGAYRTSPSFVTPALADSTRERWFRAADSIVSLVHRQRDAWLAVARTAGDSQRVHWALHDAELYRQAAWLNAAPAAVARDSLMAANLVWTLETLHPGARVALWAHDLHVGHGGDRQRSLNGGVQLGAVLRHRYGIDYRSFSLLTGVGHYRGARSMTDGRWMTAPAHPAPAGSVEAMLTHLTRRPSARGHARHRSPDARGVLVDLRVAADDPDGRWLWQPRPVRAIGFVVMDYGFEQSATMPLDYDGVLFIERTRAATTLTSPR